MFGVYVYSFHRIRTPRDVVAALSTLSLPLLDDRCRRANATHLQCLPNVFFIGASKSGTTSITEYLSLHPHVHFVRRRIFPDRHREVHRFDRNTYHLALKGIELLDEWASCPLVESAADAVIHYTPHYLYAPSVPFELAALYPRPETLKFIVVLREPSARAISSYWFQNSHLFHVRDRGSTAELAELAAREVRDRQGYDACMAGADAEAGTEAEAEGGGNWATSAAAWLVSQLDPFPLLTTRRPPLGAARPTSPLFARLRRCFGKLFRSPQLGGRHLDKGVYADQLARWFSQFPRGNFFITSTERFFGGPDEYARLLRFIGAEAADWPGTEALAALLTRNSSAARLVAPNALARLDPPTAELRATLAAFFRPHNQRLRDLGIDLFA